jgi:hypothetical protein
VLGAVLEDALDPQWTYASGLRAARGALSNYAELLVLFRSKTLTKKRREWNRAAAEAVAEGREEPPMPDWDAFEHEFLPSAVELEVEVLRTLAVVYKAAAVAR